jgi:hypothetical protein
MMALVLDMMKWSGSHGFAAVHEADFGTKRTFLPRRSMSAYRGDLNRSTQHLLILLDKEVADGDVTDIVHGEAEG